MIFRELSIADSFEVIPKIHADERGTFAEAYRADLLRERTGRSIDVQQVNTSVSAKNVLRGIHFAQLPVGQAKYVTVAAGSILDFVVDLRVGSPTLGKWTCVELSSTKRNALFISEGLGHAFLSLEDGTTVTYLVSQMYNPDREHAISPLDKDIALELPIDRSQLLISDKDLQAPSFADSQNRGILTDLNDCEAQYARAKELGLGDY